MSKRHIRIIAGLIGIGVLAVFTIILVREVIPQWQTEKSEAIERSLEAVDREPQASETEPGTEEGETQVTQTAPVSTRENISSNQDQDNITETEEEAKVNHNTEDVDAYTQVVPDIPEDMETFTPPNN